MSNNISVNSNRKWKSKIIEWLKRYGPAEFVSIITCYTGYIVAQHLFKNPIISAYCSSLSENIGYYSVIIIREFAQNASGSFFTKQAFIKNSHIASKLFTEFGFGELLDTFVFRALFIGLATHYFGVSLGVAIGKICADVIFYIPVIAMYEFHKYLDAKRHV